MPVLGIDLGGTKLAVALFSDKGDLIKKETALIGNRSGAEVGAFIISSAHHLLGSQKKDSIEAIGIAVPGISRMRAGTVWAPNIGGWEDYPLRKEMKVAFPSTPVIIESDRGCCILGEKWKGNAKGCRDVIYLTVGTGIGAGIMIEGHILHGSNDIAGAIGWMALDRPFHEKYISCGCFEHHASGSGMARVAMELINQQPLYKGELKRNHLRAEDIFNAYHSNDEIAISVIKQSIEFWGMAVANLVSLFNPEKIIFGGGVFGPAVEFIPAIFEEACKWAQPISIKQMTIEPSALKEDSSLFGAACLALQKIGAI
jgi:glucokinase